MPRLANPHLQSDLLQAALALLNERGDAAFSMRDLAARVDYAVTAVYRAYRSRAHLLQAMQLALFERLAAELMHASSPEEDPAEAIVDLGAAFLEWAVAHPAHYQFMFHSTEPESLLDENDQRIARAPLLYLQGLLEHGIHLHRWHLDEPAATATMLFATLHGLVSLHLAQRLDPQIVHDPVAFYRQRASDWLHHLVHPTAGGVA